jgi:hypothetical protein
MVYYEAGEFSRTAIIQTFQSSAAIAKGAVCTVTPAAPSTIATCGTTDASLNGPYAVAIEAATASGETIRCVVYGEVAVDASGNCYKGAYVYGHSGKAVTRTLSDYAVTKAPTLGRVTEGAASGGVCTVFVGAGGL